MIKKRRVVCELEIPIKNVFTHNLDRKKDNQKQWTYRYIRLRHLWNLLCNHMWTSHYSWYTLHLCYTLLWAMNIHQYLENTKRTEMKTITRSRKNDLRLFIKSYAYGQCCKDIFINFKDFQSNKNHILI